MEKKYSIFKINQEIFKSSPGLLVKLTIFIFANIILRLSPILGATIFAIMVNQYSINKNFSIIENIILMLPISLMALYILNKLFFYIIDILSHLYFLQKIMTDAIVVFTGRAFDSLFYAPISKSAEESPENWAFLLNKRSDLLLGFSFIYSHFLPLFIELFIISVFLLINSQYLIATIFLTSVLINAVLRSRMNESMQNLLKKYFKAESNSFLKSYELVSKIHLAKIFHSESFFIKLRTEREKLEVFSYKSHKKINEIVWAIQDIVTLVAGIIIFIISYNALLNSIISIGVFIAIQTLVASGFTQFKSLIYAFEGVSKFVEIAQTHMKIFDFADNKNNNNINDSSALKINESGDLIFNNITFAYQNTLAINIKAKNVINNINFKVLAKEKIFLIGYSGCGKTTLIKLMLNLLNPQKGTITYNHAINSDVFSYVPQHLDLIDDTIKNNLLVGKPLASDQEIYASLKSVNMLEKINNIGGINILLNNLSGGEKQRIAIARAFISGKPIIVMDEPTSSLDMKNEKIILNELMNSSISAIISIHRIHSIPLNSRCIVLEQGEIVADGVLLDLIKIPGIANKLYNRDD